MEIVVRGKHFDVPEHVEERARTKLVRLEHYLPALRDAAVEVDFTHEKAKEPGQRYLIRVTVSGHGVHLQADERAAKPEAAVDQAVRVLTGQARKHKERLYERGRTRTAKEAAGSAPVEPDNAALLANRIVRVKRFAIKPMTKAEAVEQMEALAHSFYLYHDADEEQFALLYRRKDGDYGLIVPEF